MFHGLPLTLFLVFVAIGCKKTGPDHQNQTSNNDEMALARSRSSIVGGDRHTCRIHDGMVECWGANDFRQTRVPSNIKNAHAIDAAGNHTCVIDEEGVKCWGKNYFGESNVPPFLNQPRLISTGDHHNCVIDKDGVKCWGYEGKLMVPDNLRNPRLISSGYRHTCVVDDEGVKCKGLSANFSNITKIRDIASKGRKMCVLTQDKIYCARQNDETSQYADLPQELALDALGARGWAVGEDEVCLLKDKGVECLKNSTPVPHTFNSVTNIGAGASHMCVEDQAEVKCWGENSDGQASRDPVLKDIELISMGFSNAAGGRYTCAAVETGVTCWGQYGQIFTGISDDLGKVTLLESKEDMTCALNDRGKVSCWAPIGNTAVKMQTIPDGINGVNALRMFSLRINSKDEVQICAVMASTIRCWLDQVTEVPIPPQLNLKRPKDIAYRSDHICVIDDGEVKCWNSATATLEPTPAFKNPMRIDESHLYSFDQQYLYANTVMDAEGIKFWEPGKTEVTLVIPLVNPKEYVRHCAIDDNGVHCWNLLNKVPGGLIAPHNMTSVGRRGVCVVDQGAYKCW